MTTFARILMILSVVALAPALAACAAAAESKAPAPAAAPAAKPAEDKPAVKPAEDVIIRTLPGIVVDTKAKEVRLEGAVCLRKGALELLVCSQGTREHESVVVVKAKPSHIIFALALLGMNPGKPGFMTEGGAFSPPAGEVVDITARFAVTKGEGAAKKTETVELPAWKLLKPMGASEPLDRPLQWVYVGQTGDENLKAADREGTVVCLSNFTEAVIDVPFESTSTNANLLFEANTDVLPPLRTPVELILKPTGARITPIKVETEVILKKGQPPLLDGRPVDLAALKDAVNAMPAEVRTAVLRAEPDEKFGRVMEVRDLLENALMKVRLMILAPQAKAPQKAAQPTAIGVGADDKVRIKGQTLSLDEFRTKAGDLLKDTAQAVLKVDAKAGMKTVAEVMTVTRQHVPQVSIERGE